MLLIWIWFLFFFVVVLVTVVVERLVYFVLINKRTVCVCVYTLIHLKWWVKNGCPAFSQVTLPPIHETALDGSSSFFIFFFLLLRWWWSTKEDIRDDSNPSTIFIFSSFFNIDLFLVDRLDQVVVWETGRAMMLWYRRIRYIVSGIIFSFPLLGIAITHHPLWR